MQNDGHPCHSTEHTGHHHLHPLSTQGWDTGSTGGPRPLGAWLCRWPWALVARSQGRERLEAAPPRSRACAAGMGRVGLWQAAVQQPVKCWQEVQVAARVCGRW